MKRTFIGIDPGTRHFGLAVYDPRKREAKCFLEDLLVRRSKKTGRRAVVKIEDGVLERIAFKIYEDYREHFDECALVCIERQMRRTFILLTAVLSAMLNAKGIPCVVVAPQTIRAHFGTRGGAYAVRKGKSWTTRLLPQSALDECRAAFTTLDDAGKRGAHVDPVEALMLAVYAENAWADLIKRQEFSFTRKSVTNARRRIRVDVEGVRGGHNRDAAEACGLRTIYDAHPPGVQLNEEIVVDDD